MQEYSNEEKLEVIEGPITAFHCDHGTVNLLEQIQKQSRAKSTSASIVAAAAGLHGIVASSAMLAMYDGEDVENFICRIGDKVVCGQFSGADHLKNGDQVKAVVTKEKDVYLAHAVIRHADAVLWLPVGCIMGSNADLRDKMRDAGKGCVLLYVVLLIVSYFISKQIPADIILMMAIIPPLITFPVGLWVHNDMLPTALRTENILKALGIPYPEDLDMVKSLYCVHNLNIDSNLSSNMMSMFYYQKAIEFEKQRRLKKKLPLHDSTTPS